MKFHILTFFFQNLYYSFYEINFIKVVTKLDRIDQLIFMILFLNFQNAL
jgi:hypothetical protein